jgi:hypothetical protein
MNKDELIEEIIGLVQSIQTTRKKTAVVKGQLLDKMHQLEGLEHTREVHEAEQELDKAL